MKPALTRLRGLATALVGCVAVSSFAVATPMTYVDSSTGANVTVGNASYDCTPNAGMSTCATITITATGDTSDVYYYSVGNTVTAGTPANCNAGQSVGACGYWNLNLHTALLTVDYRGQTVISGLAIDPTQLFVSVDRVNRGAGFGLQSAGNVIHPTYPVSTAGSDADSVPACNSPYGSPYDCADLSSNFYVYSTGGGGWCPDETTFLCTSTPLSLLDGSTFGVSYSFFANGYFQSIAAPAPEPATLALLGLALIAFGFARRRRGR